MNEGEKTGGIKGGCVRLERHAILAINKGELGVKCALMKKGMGRGVFTGVGGRIA